MITETYIDKTSWPDGEWKAEPDHILWLDAITGYRCIIRRSDVTGALCGYVCVNRSHPYHGKSHIEIDDIDIHGGLTYSELCSDTGQWILGFDCAHADDLCPIIPFDWAYYRNINYVENEIIGLKQQLYGKEHKHLDKYFEQEDLVQIRKNKMKMKELSLSITNNKGEKLMNTQDIKRYKEVLEELDREMAILKEDIGTISYHVEKTNKQITHLRNVYNFLSNIFTTIKLEEKENEDNKS